MPRLSRLGRLTVLLAALTPGPTIAAQSGAPADYNALRTPSSPAFVLLGVEPSSVERPNTPSDFAASILSATSNLTSLPKDFAIETSPYWLLPHRFNSWRDDTTRSVIESIERTFTLSAGTAELGTSDQPVRGLAVSGRLSLFSGRLPHESIEAIEALEQRLAASAQSDLEILAPVFDQLLQEALEKARTLADSEAALARFDEAKLTAIAALAKQKKVATDHAGLTQAAENIATARTGFMVDLAGGATWKAPNAVIDSADFDRWGLWLNASYTAADVSFIALGRYLNIDESNHDVFDIGGKFLYTRDRYAVSAEYIGRHVKNNTGANTWRLAGIFDYRVSSSIWLTGTFGRSFDDKAKGSLLAQLGLSLNLSKERYDFDSTD